MSKRPTCIATLVFLTSAGTAHAEGARVELHGGYEAVRHPSFFSPSDSTFGPTKGAVYGFGIGYDTFIGGRLFAGVEGNADFSTKTRCQVNPLILAPGIFESCLKPGRDLSLNARFGIQLGDSATRLYGLAGYSNLRITTSSQSNRGPRTTIKSEDRDGLRLGLGLEHNFDERLYGKVEYRYSHYGSGISRNQGLFGAGLRF